MFNIKEVMCAALSKCFGFFVEDDNWVKDITETDDEKIIVLIEAPKGDALLWAIANLASIAEDAFSPQEFLVHLGLLDKFETETED